jgi:enoyl-CoA hydratase/carnithine racemase
MTVDAEPLRVRRTPGVVEVVFNRPHRHNAFTTETYDKLLALCASLRDDDSVSVVVLRGAGRPGAARDRGAPAGHDRSRLVSAERAFAVGAVMEVTDFLDALLADLVDGIRSASRNTLVATKEQLLRRSDVLEVSPADDVERLERVYGAPDFAEGVRAFLAKESASFR